MYMQPDSASRCGYMVGSPSRDKPEAGDRPKASSLRMSLGKLRLTISMASPLNRCVGKRTVQAGSRVRTTWRLPACRACRSLVVPARLVCSIYVAACGARRRPSRLGLLCVLHLPPPSVLPPPSPFNPCGGGALGFPSRSELCAMKGAPRMCQETAETEKTGLAGDPNIVFRNPKALAQNRALGHTGTTIFIEKRLIEHLAPRLRRGLLLMCFAQNKQ